MGFSNASYGARELALRFDHAGAALQQPLDLVVQVTRPGGNPVTTVPFVVQVSKAAGGALALQGEAMTAAARACLSASAADPGLPACPATVGAPAAGSAD